MIRDDAQRREEQRELILLKLDQSQQAILCFTETQSEWDLAVGDLLDANVNPDPNDVASIEALNNIRALRPALSTNRCTEPLTGNASPND